MSYFDNRMNLIGVTEELNSIQLWQFDSKLGENYLKDFPIFRDVEQGIDILVYSIDRHLINYAKEGSRWKRNEYCITRLKEPIINKNGSEQKYRLPKGQGTHPFFPPYLVSAFEKKETIPTLVLTEGYFKAFKASMHGIACVGLTSITHIKDKETGALHPDVLSLISVCKVQRVIWLTDGDALNITTKELEDGVDLYRRPHNFFGSVVTFRNVLADANVDLWFMHVDSLGMGEKTGTGFTMGPKGLDDLLVAKPDKVDEIADDLLSVSKPGTWFVKFPVSHTGQEQKVLRHFRLKDVNEFFAFHSEFRPDIAKIEFVWNGNRFKYDEETGLCKLQVPTEAKSYFRVGDQYYEFVQVPDKNNNLQRMFHGRQKGTIVDDHGKGFIKHTPKYKAFCNVPDHSNFQQVIHNCFNLYAPFDHDPDPEPCTQDDCPLIMQFLLHIFGSGSVHYKDPRTGESKDIPHLELGLDYLQLLYTNPTHILPILCLVSRENETGKSTLAKLLKYIFTANCAIVGNADLANDFNSSWSSKLLVICEESRIDKAVVVEKIKALSTADKIMVNAKGKDQVEIDFFGKFMFLTNNEDNFIYASDEDLRFWVIKVPRITKKNPDLEMQMREEVPMLLSFLNRRKMVTDRVTRMWFDPELLKTDALKKVIAHSQPAIEKQLRDYMRDAFLDFACDQIMMTKNAIHRNVLNNKFESYYLDQVLRDRLKVDMYHEFDYNGKTYRHYSAAVEAAGPNARPEELATQIQKQYKQIRHTYPRWDKKFDSKTQAEETIHVEVKDNGRPFVFRRQDFVTPEDEARIRYTPEQEYNKEMTTGGDFDTGFKPAELF
jgi:hypothetical protein